MIVPAVIDYYNNSETYIFFLYTSIAVVSISLLISVISRKRSMESLTLTQAIGVSSIAWILIPGISSIPLALSTNRSLLDSFFESMSGFTGTGLTLFNPEDLSTGIKLWRSLMQWSGEFGLVVFLLAFAPGLRVFIKQLFAVERDRTPFISIKYVARRALMIYLTYTVFGIAILSIFGMDIFDAINHSMTGIATGGMSNLSEGYMRYVDNSGILIATIIIMILGTISFRDHILLFSGRFKELSKSPELKLLIAIIFLSIISLYLIPSITTDLGGELSTIFTVVSALSTTGFQPTDLSNVNDATKAYIILFMTIGGATFSTAGGIKLLRVIAIFNELSYRSAIMFARPGVIIRRAIGAHPITSEELLELLSPIPIYLSLQFLLSLALSVIGDYRFIDALFEVTSAMSCVGLSVGITSPDSDPIIKVIIIIAMYLGRLEFLQLMLILGYISSEKVRRALK